MPLKVAHLLVDEWDSVLDIMAINTFNLEHVKFYGRSDADMLEVGNDHLTAPQERTHFAIWAAMKSPLLLGCDFRTLQKRKNFTIDIVTNKYLIAFNQDENIAAPAKPFNWDEKFVRRKPPQYWSGRFGNDAMVLLFNNNKDPQDMKFKWSDTPVLQKGQWYQIIDAWKNKTIGCSNESFTSQNITGWDTSVLVMKNATGPC
jgi:alpha-galactosidase